MERSSGRRPGRGRRSGWGGAVATTAAAGVALLATGATGTEGLPLAGRTVPSPDGGTRTLEQLGAAGYADVVVRGWDLQEVDLATAAAAHGVLDPAQLAAARSALEGVVPWKAVGNKAFCALHGNHTVLAETRREQVEVLRADPARLSASRSAWTGSC